MSTLTTLCIHGHIHARINIVVSVCTYCSHLDILALDIHFHSLGQIPNKNNSHCHGCLDGEVSNSNNMI